MPSPRLTRQSPALISCAASGGIGACQSSSVTFGGTIGAAHAFQCALLQFSPSNRASGGFADLRGRRDGYLRRDNRAQPTGERHFRLSRARDDG
jgi:hypothetical protein